MARNDEWEDKSQQGNQKKYRDKLIKEGKDPKEASKAAKNKFPLPSKQAKRKNRQPGGGHVARRNIADRGDSSGRQNPFGWR